jgi:exopolysaccharide/PEP-CTERM locus tyrosine autokinase
MSLVEQALKKLQAHQSPPRGEASASAAPAAPASSPPREPVPVASAEPRGGGHARGGRKLIVDLEALRTEGLLPPDDQRRQLADQYRAIKRPLIKHAFLDEAPAPGGAAGSSRSIMVTSALPGDGKTFTCVNLALSMALEKDHTVLLVDGDVAKPHISQAFGAGGEPGLLDFLAEPERAVESVILPTDVPRLSLLPVGRRADHASELLASARMRALIRRLEELDPAGIVIVDSPPILLTSEARVLASLFGQVLLVVKANVTPQQGVLESVRIVGEGPRLGLVLNHVAGAGTAAYHYGYGYGYGTPENEETTAGGGDPAA